MTRARLWTHCWIEPKCRPKTADRRRHSRAGGSPDRLFGKWGGGLRACQIKTVFKRVAMRHMQGLEAQSIYYFHRNGRPRPPCKPLKDKPPGLIRAAVGNHLPLDLFKI
ncbi:hypothetical protein N776_11715 [Neisseria gonorrhoeae 3502]|uniref:Uncharacterized protein n=7 Tax=Neisseria gonorrhoeae TaxID=485 RepID=A0AA44ZHU8_NEIGO|nr:hypothetical protein N776_11715 [Neisseria gonorrhoeae 3502]